MRYSLLLLSLTLFPATAHAVTRNVPGDYPTIKQALAASSAGDHVVVAPGTYHENLILKSGVVLRSVAGASATTIDGGLKGRVMEGYNLSASTVVEGFTLTNGGLPHYTDHYVAGAILLRYSSPVIRDNIIRGNTTIAAAAMYVDLYSHPHIVGNLIYDNHALAGSGGGIYVDHNSSPVIQNNTIRDNTCAAWGGAIVTGGYCNATIIANQIRGNTAALGGGAAWFTRSGTPRFRDNHVFSNAGPYGGAVFVDLNNTPNIERNLFYGNTAQAGTGGAIRVSGAGGIIERNVIRDNSAVTGGGIAIDNTFICSVIGNTIVRNGGGGVHSTAVSFTLERNIIANHATGGGVIANAGGSWTCNDVWNNEPANYVGDTDPTGYDGNISADPLFCSGNLNVSLSSPCAPGNSPGDCGLIGALAPACDTQVVRVETATWGQIKAMYR